jgi:membrane protein implicated in regulation of membrane protease activity
MDTFYLILFAAGVIYAVVALFLGDLIELRLDFGDRFPFLSAAVIATFVTVFGVGGYVLERNSDLGGWSVAVVSFVSAIILAAAVFLFVKWPQYRAEKSAEKSAREMIGKTAEIVNVIKHGTKGEILYEHGGVQHSAPAETVGGVTVRQGDIVRIVGVASGTFVVEKIGKEHEKTMLA